MPFDAARIETLSQNVRAARAARDALPWADRAPAQLKVDAAEAALAAAWAAYHAEVLVIADQLLGVAHTGDVIGLFPVALEAKLEPAQGRLRLRVWPDAIAQSSHDAVLSAVEAELGRRYWIADAAATSDAQHKLAWSTLAGQLGAPRAAWVGQALTPTNLAALAPGVAPVFPEVALEDPAHPFVPEAAFLPDRWVVLGYSFGHRVLVHVGSPIVRPLVTGLDSTPSEVAGLQNTDGNPIQLPARMRWMADFATAVEAGMAMNIPVPWDLDRIQHLYVFGVRSGGGDAGRQELERVLTGHRFGQGLAFVPQETPTNNSPSGGSGLPSPADEIERAFALERKPRVYNPGLRSNGRQAALALGVAPELLASAASSGATARVYMEPDGHEQELARAMQTALWPATLGAFYEDLVPLDPARLDALRTYFIENVRAAGPVSTIRVGDQPYGVLPVTAVHAFRATAAEGIDAKLAALVTSFIKPTQPLMNTVAPRWGLHHTARPNTFYSILQSPDNKSPGPWDWNSSASNLSWASGGAIPPTWVTSELGALGGTVSSFSNIPPRPLTDAATPAALAALAIARPDVIRSGAQDGAMLLRIIRFATLLEWARFAHDVGEAALAGTAFLTGTRAAAGSSRSAWLDLLLYAFNPTGGAPFGVDAAACQRIVAAVVSLDAPSRTCPGQPRLVAFRTAVQTLAQSSSAQLEANAYSALALACSRQDAWQTSLATCRLATLRKSNPHGLVVGGFGWLHDLRPAGQFAYYDAQNNLIGGGEFVPEFIHAPSHDQAAAAAVLRSAAIRAGSAGSRHADIDLSSRRVRLARWLLEGVRNGRPLKELLGARFERRLKESPDGPALLAQLRSQFPGGAASGVVDGVALRAAAPSLPGPAFAAAMQDLDASFDALADALTAESVYQLVRGNPAGALVDIDDVLRGEAPPPLKVTETPVVGVRVTHRIVVLVPAGQAAPGWPVVHTPRADADPILDAWCGHVLGPAAHTVLSVDGTDGAAVATVTLGLDRLGVGALDVVAAAAAGGAELKQRLCALASAARPTLTGARLREDRAWKDLLGLCLRIARLIARAAPLGADALALQGDASSTPNDGDLPARAAAAQTRLQGLRETLAAAAVAPTAAIAEAAGFGVIMPGVSFAGALSPRDQASLLSTVQARLSAAAARTDARERLRALLGEGVLGAVAFTPPDAGVLATATAPPRQVLGVAASTCAAWLESMGRVRPAALQLADVLAFTEISGRTSAPALRVAQSPWVDGDPWIAMTWTNPSTKAPVQGRLSILLHAPAGVDPSQALGGFVVDSWADTVPLPARDTGLAVHFNGPDTRAPQTVLLAVAPDTSVSTWTAEVMAAALRDTLSAAVQRQNFDFQNPALIPLGHRTDGAGISFNLP